MDYHKMGGFVLMIWCHVIHI